MSDFVYDSAAQPLVGPRSGANFLDLVQPMTDIRNALRAITTASGVLGGGTITGFVASVIAALVGADLVAKSLTMTQDLDARNALLSGHLGVGNSAAATTIAGHTVVKKIEVFDHAGTSLGFLAVYDALT